jgi:integrase
LTRKDAQSFASDLQVRKDNFGTRLLQIPEPLRQEALECADRLKPFGATLSQAVTFFVQHRNSVQQSCTVLALVSKVLSAKKQAERSERYLNDLRLICGDFARHSGTRVVSEISPEDVESWVAGRGHSPTTRNNRLRTLSSAFAYAVRRRWCESNPVARVERATEHKPVAGYLTAEQARSLLQHADNDLLPCVAIQLFAGLRPCEMAELKFDNLDLELSQLWVDKEEHTTSHRVVQIMPNLQKWLLPYRSRSGRIMPKDYQKRWNDLRRRAGLFEDWPHDGLRHSFGTWHFAKFQDLGKTSTQMGHSNPMVTRKHYVVRADPSRADEYWQIEPKASE